MAKHSPFRIPLDSLTFTLIFSGVTNALSSHLSKEALSALFLWLALFLIVFRDRAARSGLFSTAPCSLRCASAASSSCVCE